MYPPPRLYRILAAVAPTSNIAQICRVFLGFGFALVASFAAASPITVDFTAQNFYSVYGSYSPPQTVVTGSFKVSSDLKTLLDFSMDIAGYHYGLNSGIAYNPHQTSAFACCGNPYLIEGTNSFELSMDPSLVPSGYVPSLAFTSSFNNDPTGWITESLSPVKYSVVSPTPSSMPST